MTSALVAQISRQQLGRARREPRRVHEASAGHGQPLAGHRAADGVHQRAGRELREMAHERLTRSCSAGSMMIGRAPSAATTAQRRQCPRVGAGHRRENPGAVLKEIPAGEAEPAALGTANGVAADEARAGRETPGGADDVALRPADVGHERAAYDALRQLREQSGVLPDRRRQHHEVRVLEPRPSTAGRHRWRRSCARA